MGGTEAACLAVVWRRQTTSRPRDSSLPSDVVHHDVEMDDGGTIHVVTRGHGQPLVLLHGVCLTSDVWAHQLSDLSDEMRVIALDTCAATGRSRPGSDGFGLSASRGAGCEDPVGDPARDQADRPLAG